MVQLTQDDEQDHGIAQEYQIEDEMWEEIESMLLEKCPPKPKKKLGRLRCALTCFHVSELFG